MRCQQRLAERDLEAGWRDVHRHPVEQLAKERKAVRVRAARRDADQHIAGADVVAGQQLRPLGDADQCAGDVERAGHVDTWHLCRLAAEQRATGRFTCLRHPTHDLGDEVGVDHRGGDVVQEEQRPRGLHQHVVDAVIDDVVPEPTHHPHRARARPWSRPRRSRRRSRDRPSAAGAWRRSRRRSCRRRAARSGPSVRSTARLGMVRGLGHDIVNHCIDDVLVQSSASAVLPGLHRRRGDRRRPRRRGRGGWRRHVRRPAARCFGRDEKSAGVYMPGAFDIAGTWVGIAERTQLLPRDDVGAGDVLIGVASSGPHTNGFRSFASCSTGCRWTSRRPASRSRSASRC